MQAVGAAGPAPRVLQGAARRRQAPRKDGGDVARGGAHVAQDGVGREAHGGPAGRGVRCDDSDATRRGGRAARARAGEGAHTAAEAVLQDDAVWVAAHLVQELGQARAGAAMRLCRTVCSVDMCAMLMCVLYVRFVVPLLYVHVVLNTCERTNSTGWWPRNDELTSSNQATGSITV